MVGTSVDEIASLRIAEGRAGQCSLAGRLLTRATKRAEGWKRVQGWHRVALTLAPLLAVGCMTVGNEFPAAKATKIVPGTTTQAEIQQVFGDPVILGIEDGNPVWTYSHAKMGVFRATEARYMEIHFDAHGVVESYSINSTDPRDLGQ